jgi:4-hydroxy-tetrahydrodipicolinate reductase
LYLKYYISKIKKTWDADAIDVVIDFSLPENFKKTLTWCQAHQKPLVTGVTGLGEITNAKLHEIMGKDFKITTPLFWSSNMSLGIALLKKFIELVKVFEPQSVEISETHHVQKKDSPSGTALSLAHGAKSLLNYKKEIPIEALRVEEVFGIHEVTFKSDDEVLRIYHEAMNRKVFASGALKVAEWLISKKESRLMFMEDFIQDVKKS